MFKKEKGNLFYEINGKTYRYDFNEGQMYGVRGKPISTTPPYMKREMSKLCHIDKNLYSLVRCIYEGTPSAEISFYEKLYSAGCLSKVHIETYHRLNKEVLDNFAEVKKVLDEMEDGDWVFSSYLANQVRANRLKKKFPNVTENELKEFVFPCADSLFVEENSKHFARYLVWYREIKELDIYMHFLGYRMSAGDHIVQFLEMSEKIGYVPQKGSFLPQYYSVIRNYSKYKEEIDIEVFKEWYADEKLRFSYGDYEVVIPTSPKDILDEANQQGNCVYRSYLEKILDKELHIVFIRRKSDLTKSVITCEIRKGGRIGQYYLAHNIRPKNEELLEFKRLYQEHLLG